MRAGVSISPSDGVSGELSAEFAMPVIVSSDIADIDHG
jgi:hypothetical protein